MQSFPIRGLLRHRAFDRIAVSVLGLQHLGERLLPGPVSRHGLVALGPVRLNLFQGVSQHALVSDPVSGDALLDVRPEMGELGFASEDRLSQYPFAFPFLPPVTREEA